MSFFKKKERYNNHYAAELLLLGIKNITDEIVSKVPNWHRLSPSLISTGLLEGNRELCLYSLHCTQCLVGSLLWHKPYVRFYCDITVGFLKVMKSIVPSLVLTVWNCVSSIFYCIITSIRFNSAVGPFKSYWRAEGERFTGFCWCAALCTTAWLKLCLTCKACGCRRSLRRDPWMTYNLEFLRILESQQNIWLKRKISNTEDSWKMLVDVFRRCWFAVLVLVISSISWNINKCKKQKNSRELWHPLRDTCCSMNALRAICSSKMHSCWTTACSNYQVYIVLLLWKHTYSTSHWHLLTSQV